MPECLFWGRNEQFKLGPVIWEFHSPKIITKEKILELESIVVKKSSILESHP